MPSPSPSESIEYESEELTRRPHKRPRGEEQDDPDYDPRVDVEVQGPRVDTNEDVEQQRLKIQ